MLDINSNLIDAAEEDDVESVRRLLKAGADVNARNVNGDTALMLAVWWEFDNSSGKEVIDLLLEAGADLDIKDKDGKTVIDYAFDSPYMVDGEGSGREVILGLFRKHCPDKMKEACIKRGK